MNWTDIQAKWAAMAQRVQSDRAAADLGGAMMNEPAPSMLPPDLEQTAPPQSGDRQIHSPSDRIIE
jgi:hypothetical protein